MNYTLHQLRLFVKVCEVKSITKASEELHLTQPAVSIQLKKLQNQFDVPLTEVVGRKLYITDFGAQIEQLAKDMLEKAELINAATNQYKGILTGRLKISSVSTGKYVIPYFLTDFMKIHPKITISIDVTNKLKVIETLQDNLTDFAIVSIIPDNLALECIPLMSNQLFLVGATDYIKEYKKISNATLNEHTLVYREHGSATRNAMIQYLHQHQVEELRSMQLESNEAVKQAVMAGIGLSIMPLIGIGSELKSGNMEIVKVKDLPIVTQWNLVYSSGKKLSPVARAFMEYIKEHKARIIDQHFS